MDEEAEKHSGNERADAPGMLGPLPTTPLHEPQLIPASVYFGTSNYLQ